MLSPSQLLENERELLALAAEHQDEFSQFLLEELEASVGLDRALKELSDPQNEMRIRSGIANEDVVYRLYDTNDNLLYVGVSGKIGNRLGQHAYGKTWFSDVAYVVTEAFRDRDSALKAEAAAIKNEAPVHNMQGKITSARPKYQRARQRAFSRLAQLHRKQYMKILAEERAKEEEERKES